MGRMGFRGVCTIDLAMRCLLLKISGSLTQCFLVVRASNRCFFSPVCLSHKTTRQISKQVRSNAVSEVQAAQYRAFLFLIGLLVPSSLYLPSKEQNTTRRGLF